VLYLVSLREQRTAFSLAQLYRSCTETADPQLLVDSLAVVLCDTARQYIASAAKWESPNRASISAYHRSACVFFSNESEAAEAIHQRGQEIAVWQRAFQSHTLLPIAVQQEHRGSPDCIEAMKLGWVLLYMSFDGKEIFVNELRSLLICT
jgi:hypothetical protein